MRPKRSRRSARSRRQITHNPTAAAGSSRSRTFSYIARFAGPAHSARGNREESDRQPQRRNGMHENDRRRTGRHRNELLPSVVPGGAQRGGEDEERDCRRERRRVRKNEADRVEVEETAEAVRRGSPENQ